MKNKGVISFMAVVTILTMGAMLALGFNSAHKNGSLKNDLKVIKCKAQNKGEAFCNEKYNYTPRQK